MAEHLMLLRAKMLEEAGEVIFAGGQEEILKELADLVTVAMSYAHVRGLRWSEVLDMVQQRNAEVGSFDKGMVWENDR
jgi:phosphoribosyl-ATP pyrophosphohydrolase